MDGSPPPPLRIFPPLLNSANPWATTQEDLKTLFECSSTGAVTTRTSLLGGFPHDPAVHQYTFFDPSRHDFPAATAGGEAGTGTGTETVIKTSHNYNASLNTLGYSPVPLDEYLGYISAISSSSSSSPPTQRKKYFIVSVTGTPDEVAECYRRVARLQAQLDATSSGSSSGGKTDTTTTTTTSSTRLAVEVNLSCPNIPDHPPPAYSGEALAPYLAALRDASAATVRGEDAVVLIPWGLKTPPYTYAAQFETLVHALRVAGSGVGSGAVEGGGGRGYSPVSFLTATNTLGSCLVLDDTNNKSTSTPTPKLTGSSSTSTGIGGLAGAPLHPLALGNVATLRRLLDAHDETRHVQIVGVGGVEDVAGYRRMRAVGAVAVGVGTALGRCGVKVFEEIEGGVGGDW